MIDLSYTRARLLAEIEAADSEGEPLSNITDPRVATRDVRVRVCGRGRHDLFPLLKAALLERFAAAARLQLIRDLLIPLRNALGNAFKHGNGRDPTKTISVELVLARKGALIAVTDEGAGFDVAVTFRRFQGDENYFVNDGCGFRNLHGAMSSVSYENGGRTVLLCYRPAMENMEPASRLPASEPVAAGVSPAVEGGILPPGIRSVVSARLDPSTRLPPGGTPGSTAGETPTATFRGAPRVKDSESSLSKVLDAEWIQACLSDELPESANGQTRIESCRVYPTCGRANDDCGNRYVLRVTGHNGEPMETRILTGRFHATEAAAAADFEAATSLHEAKISKRVLIPRPVARPAGEPRLVLYDFDSWMNLWEFLTFRNNLKSLRRRSERIGQTLAALHRSQVSLPGIETDPIGGGLQAMVTRAVTNLQMLSGGSDLVNHFHACVERLQERAASRGPRRPSPIHGAFGWDCIHYGVDRRFYLYRFEKCRQADPGLDLGGFAADLLCFTLAHHDAEVFRICHDTLLSHYNANAEYPIDEDELRFHVAFALLERLQRAEPRKKAGARQLFGALNVALGVWNWAAASEVLS